jgi:hypothetical protein
MPKGPEEFPLDRLTPDQFEILTFLLARAEFPEVVYVRAKDHGLDARQPDSQGATLRGWQSKRFLKRIYWNQCQESIRRALAFWRPLRITFTFPKILSGKEQDEFRTELIEKFPRVKLDWWDASELQPRMRDSEGGRRAAHWLFGNPEADKEELQRALAVGGELADAGQAAARVAEVQKFMGRDPHLHYTTVAREPDAPETPPASETLASFEADFGGQRVRFDASERYPGGAHDAGLGGTLLFSDDEAGRRAREAVTKVIREGGSAEITTGIAADLGPVPVGLRGLVPEELVSGEFTISARKVKRPSAPTGLPILVRSGSAELGIVLGAVEPQEGWDVTAAGSAGGLDVFMSMSTRNREKKPHMSWRWRQGEGSALEQLLAAEVMVSAHRGDPIELITPSDGKTVVVATMDLREGLEEDLREIEDVRDFLEYAAEAEAWLGTTLVPPASPSEADAQILSWLVAQIRTPEHEGKLTRVEFVLSRPIADVEEPFQIAALQPLHAELFGKERYLGLQQIHIPEARFEGAEGTEGAGDTVVIVPADAEGRVTVRLYPPTVAPEEAVHPVS